MMNDMWISIKKKWTERIFII